MLDHLGYDVSIIGNHDWLKGPDALLGIMNLLQPKVQFLGSNLSFSQFNRQVEMNRWIHPFTIREVNGTRIGFIGLSTYEFIYDKYFSPVEIQEPFFLTRKLAFDLKQVTDLVVVISHNSVLANQAILKAAPEADIIVGGHDHQKLNQPLIVERTGAQPGWIVEAGSWGKYLGKADFAIHQKHVELKNYELIQIDRTIPDHAETLEKIEQIENRITKRFGPIFNDHIAESEIEFNRTGIDNLMGNLVTDSYISRTGSDLAMDSYKFIYGEIHRGKIDTVDIYNANPSVYDLKKGKNWTLKTLPILGKILNRYLTFYYFLNNSLQ